MFGSTSQPGDRRNTSTMPCSFRAHVARPLNHDAFTTPDFPRMASVDRQRPVSFWPNQSLARIENNRSGLRVRVHQPTWRSAKYFNNASFLQSPCRAPPQPRCVYHAGFSAHPECGSTKTGIILAEPIDRANRKQSEPAPCWDRLAKPGDRRSTSATPCSFRAHVARQRNTRGVANAVIFRAGRVSLDKHQHHFGRSDRSRG